MELLVENAFLRQQLLVGARHVILHLASRRMLLAATTTSPSAKWLAQQLRPLTPFGQGPKFLRSRSDAKFGTVFDEVANGAGVRVVAHP